ncbi:MAG: 2-oxoglutarate and iron-dependent oxygenase domain-containing protein [Pseudomonadota bacterium]
MSYAATRRIEVSDIPVIDLAPLLDDERATARVGEALRRAAEEVGFLYVKNHGIPERVIAEADRQARAFFALPLEQKETARINAYHHGFLRVGEAKMREASRTDLKESFVWGLDLPDDDPAVNDANPFLGRNRWPAGQTAFRGALTDFFDHGLACGRQILRAFALSLGLPAESFVSNWRHPIARASVIYYPAQPPLMGEEQFGVAPHTDFGCLTLLWQDQIGGLEVQTKTGEWVTAHPIEGTLVVNVGDLLSRWTNDAFRSTPHRVINRAGVERHSMVVAADPDFETMVDPAIVCRNGETPHYQPVSCGDYILSRFDESFAYRKAEQA